MATQITADLPTLDFPREVDYPTQEDWAAFSDAAEENFGILGGDWSTQMQLWKTQANAMSIELNNSADIAQSTVNYKGDWISQGYALNESVSVSGIYYICKLTHATGQNPTDVGSIYWNLALGNWNLKVNTNMSGYASKTTPVDADLIPLSDSAATFGIKKLTWANIKATIISSFGVMISTLTAKTTPVDADIFTIGDSAASNASRKLTWANVKATLLTYFDTLYSRTSAIFGINQTWQNVTASRASGVTYTNTTGKPIELSIRVVGTLANEGSVSSLSIDGATLDGVFLTGGLANVYGFVWIKIIPPASTYKITNTQYTAIHSWFELR